MPVPVVDQRHGATVPGAGRRVATLNNQPSKPNSPGAVPRVDTAGVRATYRALLGPDPDSGPALAVLAVVRQVPRLCDEVDRLARLLLQARRAYADLAAAARAALAAHAEGEADPWWYLRDELGAQPTPPVTNPPAGRRTGRRPGARSGGGRCGRGWC